MERECQECGSKSLEHLKGLFSAENSNLPNRQYADIYYCTRCGQQYFEYLYVSREVKSDIMVTHPATGEVLLDYGDVITNETVLKMDAVLNNYAGLYYAQRDLLRRLQSRLNGIAAQLGKATMSEMTSEVLDSVIR